MSVEMARPASPIGYEDWLRSAVAPTIGLP
jgi:hypothetical protein